MSLVLAASDSSVPGFPKALNCRGRETEKLLTEMNAPIRVAVTGAAGQIGYSLLFRIASGAMFGPDQPVILHLIEIEPALKVLNGVVMELMTARFRCWRAWFRRRAWTKAFVG